MTRVVWRCRVSLTEVIFVDNPHRSFALVLDGQRAEATAVDVVEEGHALVVTGEGDSWRDETRPIARLLVVALSVHVHACSPQLISNIHGPECK